MTAPELSLPDRLYATQGALKNERDGLVGTEENWAQLRNNLLPGSTRAQRDHTETTLIAMGKLTSAITSLETIMNAIDNGTPPPASVVQELLMYCKDDKTKLVGKKSFGSSEDHSLDALYKACGKSLEAWAGNHGRSGGTVIKF